MKKQLLSALLLSGLSLTVCACTSAGGSANAGNPTPEPNPGPIPGNGRSLIVYFSCTNTTKAVAEQIANITDGECYRVVPKVGYTSEDLNYNNSSSRANREQNDASARPEISSVLENMADYDVVYLGYPIWWGRAPKIISTFLESQDFAGKTVVPFCTSGSSGIGSSDTELHALASRAKWEQGRRFRGGETKQEITNWIESLNLN